MSETGATAFDSLGRRGAGVGSTAGAASGVVADLAPPGGPWRARRARPARPRIARSGAFRSCCAGRACHGPGPPATPPPGPSWLQLALAGVVVAGLDTGE